MPRRVQVTGDLFHGNVPDGAVYIGRAAPGLPTSEYANPYKPGRCPRGGPTVRDTAHAVALYRQLLDASPALVEKVRAELAGRDLACWCKAGQACHGDVLLEYANPEPATRPLVDLAALHTFRFGHLQLQTAAGGAALLSPGGIYRYALTRIWDPAGPLSLWVMLNPSTADAAVDDMTIRRCRGFSRDWGCGGFAVVNAYALRSAQPRALDRASDPVGPDNDAVISAVVSAAAGGGGGPVIVAWGTNRLVAETGRADDVLKLLEAGGADPKCLAVTAGGHPRHPLRLPSNATLLPYRSPAKAGPR